MLRKLQKKGIAFNLDSSHENWSQKELKCMFLLFFLLSPPRVKYIQYHKTLPKSSLQLHWISVRFYEMGDIVKFVS